MKWDFARQKITIRSTEASSVSQNHDSGEYLTPPFILKAEDKSMSFIRTTLFIIILGASGAYADSRISMPESAASTDCTWSMMIGAAFFPHIRWPWDVYSSASSVYYDRDEEGLNDPKGRGRRLNMFIRNFKKSCRSQNLTDADVIKALRRGDVDNTWCPESGYVSRLKMRRILQEQFKCR